jgi:hypothetical protein
MAPTPSSSSGLSQKRKAVTDDERKIIRKRAREHPCHQSEPTNWFYQERGHQLDQSQISRILSSKYDYLDSLNRKKDKDRLQSQRQSAGDWPELEAALFEWQQRMQKKQAVITCEILKQQAAKLWSSLPQYQEYERLSSQMAGLMASRSGLRSENSSYMVRQVLRISISLKQSIK